MGFVENGSLRIEVSPSESVRFRSKSEMLGGVFTREGAGTVPPLSATQSVVLGYGTRSVKSHVRAGFSARVGRLSLRESVLHDKGHALDAPHLLIISSLQKRSFAERKATNQRSFAERKTTNQSLSVSHRIVTKSLWLIKACSRL